MEIEEIIENETADTSIEDTSNVETSEEIFYDDTNIDTYDEEYYENDEEILYTIDDLENLIELSSDTASLQMSPGYIALSSIHLVISIVLILVILRQSKSSSVISGLDGGQTYWSQNKGRSKESKLAKLTVILAVLFLIVTILISFV